MEHFSERDNVETMLNYLMDNLHKEGTDNWFLTNTTRLGDCILSRFIKCGLFKEEEFITLGENGEEIPKVGLYSSRDIIKDWIVDRIMRET